MAAASLTPVPSGFVDGVVRYIEASSLTVKRALDEVEVHRQAQQKAAALQEVVLKRMLETGVVKPQHKEAAQTMLGAHAETMQLLKSAVDKIAELDAAVKKAAEEPGSAVDDPSAPRRPAAGTTKQAGEYDSLTDPMVGRRTDRVKESDKPLLALAGIVK